MGNSDGVFQSMTFYPELFISLHSLHSLIVTFLFIHTTLVPQGDGSESGFPHPLRFQSKFPRDAL